MPSERTDSAKNSKRSSKRGIRAQFRNLLMELGLTSDKLRDTEEKMMEEYERMLEVRTRPSVYAGSSSGPGTAMESFATRLQTVSYATYSTANSFPAFDQDVATYERIERPKQKAKPKEVEPEPTFFNRPITFED